MESKRKRIEQTVKKPFGQNGFISGLRRSQSYNGSGQPLLHGHIIIHVREARGLKDMEKGFSKLFNKKDVSDPFVDVKLGQCRIAKTRVIDNSLDPNWDELFKVEVCHHADNLIFDVRDKDHASTEVIGEVVLSLQQLIDGQTIDGWFQIKKSSRTRTKVHGELNVRVQFVDKFDVQDSYDVDSYFRMHRGCHVTLYQDVKVPDNLPYLNSVRGPHGKKLELSSCWGDIYESIIEAKHLICITGWSVWADLKLFRGEDAKRIYGGTLGELLCRKADQGAEVKVMVWHDSVGMMGTYCDKTQAFFKNSRNYQTNRRVSIALASRGLEETKELTDKLQNTFSMTYTHHQKTVICDAEDPGTLDGRRRLVAYVGGLDLTSGRYDTPEHELFSSLNDEHRGDFRNSNIGNGTTEHIGPREPWHDIHSKVEGPIASDVLENFIERWRQQGTKEGPAPDIRDLARVINPEAQVSTGDREWSVQVFRSITSDAAVFHPEKKQSDKFVLSGKKGKPFENSIAKAYIQTIRGAQKFIYIENQYFMGSAFEWDVEDTVLCNHTIPAEIVAKIRDKMFERERFVAYIVIPMWPEGDPQSAPMQEILHWQSNTMRMMYREVGRALREANVPPELGQHPFDWLIFLCPGKRELYGPHLDSLDAPQPGSLGDTFRQTMRQMIYVHSKMMIVDDAYIIVGSANINERSMSGTRDSEIAVGSWQPKFTAKNPDGDVHMFRIQLWASHLQLWDSRFRHPESLETTRKLFDLCWYNWQSYNFEKYGLPVETPPIGKLLLYPIQVNTEGELTNLEMFETFPDYNDTAKVLGGRNGMIPEKLTT